MQNKSSSKVKGIHIITTCDVRSGRAQRIEKTLEEIRLKRQFLIKVGKNTRDKLRELWMEYHWYLEQLHKRHKVNQIVVENVTTTVGRAVLAQRLGGDTTYTGTVNYGALGTDNTGAAVSDTTLGTETYRKALSSGTDSNNIAYLENFYTASEVNGTFEEYGFFIDGTGSADTGQMFNRFTQSVTKSATESLNVSSQITISDA